MVSRTWSLSRVDQLTGRGGPSASCGQKPEYGPSTSGMPVPMMPRLNPVSTGVNCWAI